MAKYRIDDSTLKGLADALRKVTGETRTYTPTEMIEAVSTILESGIYMLVDENGNEVPAVFAGDDIVFTATENDIRLGSTAATERGITVGTKDIPKYRTYEGVVAIPSGSAYSISLPVHDAYDFTKLQAIICPYNISLANSVGAEKVSIEGKVYPVNSLTELATVTVDHENKSIHMGITNEEPALRVIRYFTYKEEK